MSSPSVSVDTVRSAVTDRSAAGIAGALHRLIRSGRLTGGDRLPTVRDLAAALGTSPATVAEAWRALATTGAIVARGRAGTFVSTREGPAARYDRLATAVPLETDLSTGVPDPSLLPDLGPALARVGRRASTGSYLDDPVLPELAALLRADWPYPVEALTVVDGALDAIDRLLRQTVRLGDHVAVENPGFPPVLDMLDRLGASVVPLDLDSKGVRPESLAAAMDSSPVVIMIQPRAQNPTGASMTAARVRTLTRVIRSGPNTPLIVENNHSGSIAASPDVSFGRALPEQTVHVRSYSKSHGPDLRVAAVGGPAAVLDDLVVERHYGPGWTSRLIQGVLADLLADPAVVAGVAAARDAYATRRSTLAAALAARGVRVGAGDGLAVWVPVADERHAVVTLAAAGVGVSPGSLFACGPMSPHVRLTLGSLPADVDPLADLLVTATGRPAPTVRAMRSMQSVRPVPPPRRPPVGVR